MPSRAGVEGTEIPQGIIARALAAIGGTARDAVRGWQTGWFGPGVPMAQAIPDDAGYPRRMEYPVGWNAIRNPQARDIGSPSFPELRALSNLNTYTRLAIETCKDEVSKVSFAFRPKRMKGESLASVSKRKNDPRIAMLNQFFEYPGRAIHYPENPDDGPPQVVDCDWDTWLREFLEDVFVIDAPAVNIVRNVNTDADPRGGIYSLDVIDGATIKPILDRYGNATSYQQWLYGVPGKILGPDQLYYRPRNPRTSKVYGFSQVEQILVIVNIMLRRLSLQLAHYTDGNIPEALIKAPESWGPDQVEKFQKGFDAYFAGSSRARAKLTWIPSGGGDIKLTKVESLKTEEDEWWVRVNQYAFSLSAQWASRMMNRATAETAQETAKEQGLMPTLNYVASSLTGLVRRVWRWDDIEAASEFEQDVNALDQAEVDKTYVSIGALSLNEVREKIGKDPIPGGDQHLVYTPQGPMPLPGEGPAPEQIDGGQKLLTDGKAPAPADGKQPEEPPARARKSYVADQLARQDYKIGQLEKRLRRSA